MRACTGALACVVLMFAAAGCAGVAPQLGLVHADVRYPEPHIAAAAVLSDGVGTKRGEATSMNIMGLVALGDCSLEAAMRDGGITTVYTVDHYLKCILGVYAEWTTVVTGE